MDCSSEQLRRSQSVSIITQNVPTPSDACKSGEAVFSTCTSSEALQPSAEKKQRLGVKESKEIRSVEPQNWAIIFESYPVWIFSLTPDIILKIYLPNFDSWTAFRNALLSTANSGAIVIYDAIVSRLGRRKFLFKDPPPDCVWLVSGSINYINGHLLARPGLGVVDSYNRGRRLPSSALRLVQLQHNRCGGATTFRTLWCSSKKLILHTSAFRRSIRDFLDYGNIKGTFFDHLPPTALTEDDLLPFHKPDSLITIKHLHRYLQRRLSGFELGLFWGLPRSLATNVTSSVDLPLMPVHITDHVLSEFLTTLPSTPLRRATATQFPLPLIPHDVGGTYISSLKRILPHTWRDEAETHLRAAKHDDAPVNFGLWNWRVRGLFRDASDSVLDCVRRFLLRHAQRQLYLEFIKFLWDTHPNEYGAWLQHHGCYSRVTSMSPTRGGTRFLPWTFSRHVSSDDPVISSSRTASWSAEFLRDLRIGSEAVTKILNSTFWEWNQGSSLLFWRWPLEFRRAARDGFPPYFLYEPPHNKSRQGKIKNDEVDVIWSKMKKFLERNYITIVKPSFVKNLTHFFIVPKGDQDVRMVFNGTKSGLTDALWAPSFWLPNAVSMLRSLSFGHKSVDIDLGKHFLNHPIHETLVSLSAIDLTPFRAQIAKDLPHLSPNLHDKGTPIYGAWSRAWMGAKPSPEWAVRFYYVAEEFVRGNQTDKANPFFFDKVVVNAPGDPTFNPGLPWVFKYDSIKKRVAGDVKAYVDDLRSLGYSLEHAWILAKQIASRLQYLGIQDAPRKRRIDQGPWAGTVYGTTVDEVTVSVTIDKWNKGKAYIQELIDFTGWDPDMTKLNDISIPDVELNFKHLERVRGYLCHLAMTFPILFPYLKGFHLTLCSHLPGRDKEGWKRQDLEKIAESQVLLEKFGIQENETPSPNPTTIKGVPRFYTCLSALSLFFTQEQPPRRSCRKSKFHFLVYGFVDASKSGLGSTKSWDDKLTVRMGTWGSDTEDESSNWREFTNLVEDLEEEEKTGDLKDSWIILATDNSTVEGCLYKGNSPSMKLYDLVVRLRALELRTGSFILVTHVAGKRMVAQGTDGVSRGSLREGVCLGDAMTAYCPWGKSPTQRSPLLLEWIKDWFATKSELLEPRTWFSRGHDHKGGHLDENGFWRPTIQSGLLIWDLPPVAADAAIEELRKARMKRRTSTHLVVVPKLFTPLWMKQLYKVADLILFIPPYFSFWNESMFESLCIGFCFPFLRHRPWQLKRAPKLLELGRKVHVLCKENRLDPRDLLRELLRFTRRLPSLSRDQLWKVLHFGRSDDLSGKKRKLSVDRREGSRKVARSVEGSAP